MQLVADLHLHSKYSRATSKALDLFGLYQWCLKKGISLIGTADFTHPKWFGELKEYLEPSGEGLYKLKSEFQNSKSQINSNFDTRPFTLDKRKGASVKPYYVLTSEISCIYTQDYKMRRIHVVLLAPSLETVEKINQALAKRGNLFSDGRPIFGISAYDLVKLVWDIDDQIVVIPAHIWTPWFSLFGSMSGFDSIEECFKDLSDRIYAIETGLSSDPAMNWRLSQLDRVAIVSFGDGHSGGNLMREATVMELGDEPSFEAIMNALKNSNARVLEKLDGIEKVEKLGKPYIVKTIEFYPEEGKYHFDGHRACGIRFAPDQSRQHDSICPKCHRPLTIGVMNRVERLADRSDDYTTEYRPSFQKLVQLSQIIAEAFGKTETSLVVKNEYGRLVDTLDNEYNILVTRSLEDLSSNRVDSRIIEGIGRVREGKIHIEPGYDGVFGAVRVFGDKELKSKALSKPDHQHLQQKLF